MASIELPDDQFAKLSEQASAAGFINVATYLQSLADEAAFDLKCGMTDEELRQSAAECDRINEEMKEGGGHDAREALSELGKKFGFKMPR